jgi:hypothetical protein
MVDPIQTELLEGEVGAAEVRWRVGFARQVAVKKGLPADSPSRRGGGQKVWRDHRDTPIRFTHPDRKAARSAGESNTRSQSPNRSD